MDAIKQLQEKLSRFAEDREWDQFHSPKNLAIALSVECSELLEHFQWLDPEASETENLSSGTKEEIELEMADVFLYLLRLADRLDIDLVETAERKIGINGEKYPVSLSKGNSIKYSKRNKEA